MQNSKDADMPQHPKHLGTSASAATEDFGPALGFIYQLSVALTAVVKGQVFPPSPSFVSKIIQACFGECLCLPPWCATRDVIQILRGRAPTSPRNSRFSLHITVALHPCYKTNAYQKRQICGTRIMFPGASHFLHTGLFQ